MRIQISRESEQLGAVTIHGVYNVIELDSGPSDHESNEPAIARIPLDKIRKIQNEMVIVVPIKDEKFKLFENVLSGIPNNVQIIVVSNSTTQPLNRFAAEKKILDRYSKFTYRTSVIVHQKDERIANALREAGYEELLGEDGKIRNGKGEGMVLGIILAKALGKKYVGFVDADNYFPGSVWEYVTVYAAGLSLLDSPFSMVRIVWKYKPKVIKGLYFKRRGRVSVITNRYLNFLISMKLGFETEIIKTGNSGEHIMTMDLAERISFAGRFAVETFELMNILERYSGFIEDTEIDPIVNKKGIEILQVETLNPHLHENKGIEHIKEMIAESLGVIYHSPLCEDQLKSMILDELHSLGAMPMIYEPPIPRVYPPISRIDIETFRMELREFQNDIIVGMERDLF